MKLIKLNITKDINVKRYKLISNINAFVKL